MQLAAPRPPRQGRSLFAWPFSLAWVSAAGGTLYDPTDDPQNIAFQCVSGDCQREESRRATLPVTVLTTQKNIVFSMFFNPILARDPPPGQPRDLNLSPETPLGHCTGPKPDFHRFLVSFWRSGGRPRGLFWRPWGTCGRQMPPKETPQMRKSGDKVVSDGLLAKIFKKVGFRIRFKNDFGINFSMLL